MNIIELMDVKASSFSKTDRLIYESIRKFPEEFATESITALSERTGYSKPALSRFAKKLGFSGYAEFQYQFSQELKNKKDAQNNSGNAEVYGNLLKQVEQTVDRNQIKDLLSKMQECRVVQIYGSNLSRLPAEMLYISLQFSKSILPMLPPHDAPPVNHDQRDMYLFYSAISGDSHQKIMKNIRKLPPEKRPYMVLVTTNSKHPLRHNFDQVIALPSASLASSSQIVFSDTFAFMMFNDIVLGYLNQLR